MSSCCLPYMIALQTDANWPRIASSYPKHVWSPSGGWYCQPANWKGNTAIIGAVALGIIAMTFNLSAEREYRTKFPEEGRFFPSRWYTPPRNSAQIPFGYLLFCRWSKQIIEHEREQQAAKSSSA